MKFMKRQITPVFLPFLVLVTLKLAAQPVITQQPTNQMVLAGAKASLYAGVSGVGPFTFQWQFNGTNLNNISNLVATVAGGKNLYVYFGDGGPATNAALHDPAGVVVDPQGNLLIADTANSRIRKVDTNGIITTVAGNGEALFGGDGGMAINAFLYLPQAVAADGSGNLFIADTDNNRIREVGTNGIITTVAGGKGASSGVGDGLAATNANLSLPDGVCLDAVGNLYIADKGNNRIRQVNTNGIISTVAGNGSATFAGDGGPATSAGLPAPAQITMDCSGGLIIAGGAGNRVRRVDTNGIISTIAGTGSAAFSGDGGLATNACLDDPSGVVTDLSGNLFIVDSLNNCIREVYPTALLSGY
jgi:sugar lactone lactonase YvrE